MQKHAFEIGKLLDKAGKEICRFYEDGSLKTRIKNDNSPVTDADEASSKIINHGLKKLLPDFPVLDEEHPIPEYAERQKWGKYFLLDPLDGTKEFIKHNGEFCINLALMQHDRPLEGWIYQPLMQKGWYARKGEGIYEFSTHNGFHPLNSPAKTRSETIHLVASRSFFTPLEAALIEEMQKFCSVKIIHKGSSLKQIGMIKGEADMYLKAGPCSEWDTAPGQLLVEEFGGAVLRMSDFHPMRYNKGKMANPYFVMLNQRLNNPSFIDLLKIIMKEIGSGNQY